MSQILDRPEHRPALATRLAARPAVTAARLLAALPPRRIVAVLSLLRRGARPATYEEALAARRDVTAASTSCAGNYCLPRSLAVVLLCRSRGYWPTWCTGVRTPPFAAHAWVQVDGRPVGEGSDSVGYHLMLAVPPLPDRSRQPVTDEPDTALTHP
ncbi:lasso peptide biosynthesis B2 protein [Actinomadura gamaensis]|uniref:Lasso peptide biosynthesis B2 protein n=1 Tax=Actinomadura gamaensis TaxID=1763541 RepID=A0ABV9UCE0_9ACTN